MKLLYLIYFLSIFHIIHPLDLGGIKFAISEKMAGDLLYHFYPAIMKEVRAIPLKNMHIDRGINVENLVLSITDFNLDQVKLKFSEKGINIKILELKGYVTGILYFNKYLIKEDKDIRVDFKVSNLNGNIIVKTKKDKKNKLVPYAQFSETPTYSLELDVDLENTLWLLDEAIEPKLESELEDAINSAFPEKSNELLNDALEIAKNYTVMPIDEPKGLYIDYSLVDIKMRNGFLEINSYAFLYNKNKPETMQPKRIPFTMLPQISSIDTPNQLFISEYSLNSALYTYFITYPLSLKINVDPNILESLLPTIGKEIAENTEVFFETTEPPTLSLKLSYIKGEIFGKVTIKVKGRDDLTIVCSLQLSPKLELIIKDDIILTGKIYELDIKINGG